MRFRSLAVFVLSAGVVGLLGAWLPADAQAPAGKKQKRLEKLERKQAEVLPPPPAGASADLPRPVPPLPTVVPAPARQDAAALARLIDAEIHKKLADARLQPSPRADDAEFLRRVCLDLTGTIPTAERARAFLDSPDPDKRARLIDELLTDPLYGRRMADLWTAKLFPRDSANRFVRQELLYQWLQEQFNRNTPWDQLVARLITAEGTAEENPAVTFFLANRSLDKLTDATTQHFLGVQLQCAQCHDHPFTDWKQAEYWGLAAFYVKVQIDNPRNPKTGADASQLGVREGPGRSRVKDFFPESARTVPAKFLGGPHPRLNPAEPFRPVLARWLTSPDNPFFARAMVNRAWAHLFGTGLVNPVDDMLPENTPSHPELLDALARHMAGPGGFDLKYLLRAICLSETYQRTSKPTPGNKDDKTLFSHMTIKVMSPEQLFDSLARVTGSAVPVGRGQGAGAALRGQGNDPRTRFVTFFLAGAEAANPLEYEAGIPQALRLMNSPLTNNPNVVRAVVGTATDSSAAFERIYLTVLSRRPTPAERQMLADYLARVGHAPTAYADVLWATLNSSEFVLIR